MIEFSLLGMNHLVGGVAHLQVDQLAYTVAQCDHALDSLLRGGVQLRPHHQGVLPIIYLIIHDGIGIVTDIRVGRNSIGDSLAFLKVGKLRYLIPASDVLHGRCQLNGEVCSLNGFNSEVLLSVLGRCAALPTDDHLRMIDKVGIDRKAIRVGAKIHPVRVDFNGAVTLLQEDDVRDNIGTGVSLEGIVGKSDRTKELCALGNVSANLRRLLIHRVARGNKGNHTTGAHLIQCLCEKVVMNGKTQLVVSWVMHLVVAKGDITDGEVEEVTPVRGLKTGNSDVRLGIELLRNPAGDAVQLHTIQAAGRHAFRQHTEEITHAHGGLQNVTRGETHALNGFIDRTDNGGAGIVSIQGGCSRCFIFRSSQQILQLSTFRRPGSLGFIKSICQTTPAHITGKDLLLGSAGRTGRCFQTFEDTDSIYIGSEFRLGSAFAKVFVIDAVIFGDDLFFKNSLNCDGRFRLITPNLMNDSISRGRIILCG